VVRREAFVSSRSLFEEGKGPSFLTEKKGIFAPRLQGHTFPPKLEKEPPD